MGRVRGELVVLLGRGRFGLAVQDLSDFLLDLLDVLLDALGLVEVLPIDCPSYARPLFSELHGQVVDLDHSDAVLLRLIEVLPANGLLLIGSQPAHELSDVLLILSIAALALLALH